jgi:hypothetical protein
VSPRKLRETWSAVTASSTVREVRRRRLAHIDADWYQSVRTCLERIEPK